MAIVVLKNENRSRDPFAGLAAMFQQMAAQQEEQRRNDALLQAYMGMKQAETNGMVEPYRQNNERAQQGAVAADARNTAVHTANNADTQNLMTPEIQKALMEAGATPADVSQPVNPALTQSAGGQPVTPEMEAGWASKANQMQGRAEQGASSAADLLTQAEKKFTPKTMGFIASMVGKPGMDATKLIAMAENMDTKERAAEQERINKTAFAKAYGDKTLDDAGRVNLLLSEGVNPEHPLLKILATKAGTTPKAHVVGRGGVMVDANGNVLYQNPMTYSPGGGGGGRAPAADKPVNPNTHDPNTGARLGPQEKWAQSYELRGLHSDEALLGQYEEYLSLFQADPESLDGMMAKKWLDKNQKTANAASDRRNQYWTISSGSQYKAGQSEAPSAPAGTSAPAAQPNESPEDRERRLKAVLGLE